MTAKRKRDDKKGIKKAEAPAPVENGVLDAELTFDRIYDALNYDPTIDGPDDLDEYRRAWQLRRDLAELSRRPEGYFFTWRASDGRIYGAPLLTPPDLEAVQRADGTWYRTRRQLDPTLKYFSPIPYSEQWYSDYLHYFGLPTYFLREGHVAMIRDDLEGQRLGMMNAPSPQYATIPRRDYLNFRFSALPHWPMQSRNGTYRINIESEGARANLARHFPALSVTQFPYRAYVLPLGHIQLRSMSEVESSTMLVRAEGKVDWESYEEDETVPSSYHRETTVPHPATRPSEPREALIQDAIDRHAVINPLEDVPGQGRLAFLSPADEREARRLGYVNDERAADLHAVIDARIRGELAVGTGPNAGPIVVFWPDEDLLNPCEQPEGPGAWRFLTTNGISSNRGFAAINFGGSHGLPTYPTASQIRRLGQLFIEDGRQDLTSHIDIVWVPGEEDEEPGDDPVLDGTVETVEEEVSPTVSKKKRRARRVSVSVSNVSSPPAAGAARRAAVPPHPHHDPTNNGGVRGTAHDQTGDPTRAEYETAWAHGRWNTIDRSRVRLGKVDKHKFYCYSSRGWVQWSKWADMDWDDPKCVSDLNKYREQTHQRAKYWQKRRTEPRHDYTDEENQYIMDFVVEAKGNRPKTPLKEIAKEFNKRFPSESPRNDTGIQSLIDRLRVKYHKHDGVLPAKKGRGWKQQELSRQSRGAGGLTTQEGGENGEESEQGEESDVEREESDAEGEDVVGGDGDGEDDDEEDAEGEDDE